MIHGLCRDGLYFTVKAQLTLFSKTAEVYDKRRQFLSYNLMFQDGLTGQQLRSVTRNQERKWETMITLLSLEDIVRASSPQGPFQAGNSDRVDVLLMSPFLLTTRLFFRENLNLAVV